MDDADDDFTEDDRLFQFNLKQLETLSGDRARAGLQANICRQLVSQLAENVVNQDQEPLARYDQIRDFISRAHDLVDDPKGINNYSDACLNEASKFVNKANKWVSSLSVDDPEIEALINLHDDDVINCADEAWNKCMASELNPPVKEKKEINSKPANTLASFDLLEDDFMEVSDDKNTKTNYLNNDNGHSSHSRAFGSKFVARPSHGPSNNVQTLTRAPSHPPRSAFIQKVWGHGVPGPSSFSHQNVPQDQHDVPNNKPSGNRSDFRTAAQQLGIDQVKKNDRGISRSNYSAGKNKQLGVNGPSSSLKAAFKPPVRDSNQDNSNLRTASTSDCELENDPRYKNVDPKMVELIKNEIMDCGQEVAWDDIAGLDFAKETVKEIVVYPLLRPDIFTGLRGPPKGLLLFGPPGTGKTLIGKCIAHQSNCTFFSISASSLTSKWVGEGEKMVRALFAVAKVHQPSVVFIDEIDSLLTSRSEGEHESSRKIKTEFLVQLDGANTVGDERVLVVGATNRPQELDDAARRRLVKRLYIPLPDLEARVDILSRLLGKEKHDVDRDEMISIGAQTEGYSGADMANLCREAAYGPIRSLDLKMIANVTADQVRPINHGDLVSALRQVKASVSQDDLDQYLKWDKQFGASK